MDSIHPAAVHFPIVLTLLWPVVDALGWTTRRPDLSRLAVALLLLALVSSIVATATGQVAFDAAVARGVDPALLRSHSSDGDLVPWALVALSAARLGLPVKLGRAGHAVAFCAGLIVGPYILFIGHAGGALVFEHGVGVRAQGAVEAASPSP